MASTRTMRILMGAVIMTVVIAGAASAGTPGDAGFLSLRLGIGAREAAMGNAGVASSAGAAAAYWNPALAVTGEKSTTVLMQHNRWLGLFDHNAAALVHSAGDQAVGVIFNGLFSDPIERREGLDPLGSFEPYDVAVGVSYSRRLVESVAVGAQVKLLYEKIDFHSDTGFAGDLFIAHRNPRLRGFTIGASVTNIGGQMNLNQEPFDLPLTILGGISYTPVAGPLLSRFTLAGDIAMPNDASEKAHLGAEFRVVPEFALRGGYRANYDSQGLTAGAGFRLRTLGVDYAYQKITADGLDDGHKFALQVYF